MIREKLYCFSAWCRKNKKTIFYLIIFFALSRFFYLNYINWTSGALCTGKGGIQYGYDAARYIDGADRLINHQKFIEKENRYTGYILLIALVKYFGFNLSFVLIFQLIFALLASLTLYDLGRSVSGSRLTGILAASFFLVNPFIVQWHLFIHTESIYSSMLAISAWSIFKAVTKNNLKLYVLSLIIIIYTELIRPNGWVLIPVFIVFAIIAREINFKKKLLSVASVVMSFLIIIICFLAFNKNFKEVKTADLFMKGEIIWGHKDLRMKMPQELNPGNNSMSVFNYVAKHPVAVAKLSVARITAELLPVFRPNNSMKFNIRFLLWMLPAYIFSLIAAVLLRKITGMQILFTIIILHLCIIAVTFSDQEFRFLTYILPLISLTGALGFNEVYKLFMKRYHN